MSDDEVERENFRKLLPGQSDFHVEIDDHLLGRIDCWLPEQYRARFASLNDEEKRAMEKTIFLVLCSVLGAIGTCLDGGNPSEALKDLHYQQELIWNNLMEKRHR